MDVPTQRLEEAITRERTTEPFSGVVSLRHRHVIVFERAYGAALRSESIPNQIDTRFQIASGSKIFTSVAICQLIERGVLSPNTLLTDCVDVPFPQFDPLTSGCFCRVARSHGTPSGAALESSANSPLESAQDLSP